MNKKIIIIFALLLGATPLFAQQGESEGSVVGGIAIFALSAYVLVKLCKMFQRTPITPKVSEPAVISADTSRSQSSAASTAPIIQATDERCFMDGCTNNNIVERPARKPICEACRNKLFPKQADTADKLKALKLKAQRND